VSSLLADNRGALGYVQETERACLLRQFSKLLVRSRLPGGDSQLAFAKGVQAEFCATYHTTSIPTVMYGLKSNITNGPYTVHAQSGCVTTAGSGCDLVSDGGNGTKPTFFFAPDRVTKRSEDWGRDGLQTRVADAWHPFCEWTGGWLETIQGHGFDALQAAYMDVLEGRVDPAHAHVLTLPE